MEINYADSTCPVRRLRRGVLSGFKTLCKLTQNPQVTCASAVNQVEEKVMTEAEKSGTEELNNDKIRPLQLQEARLLKELSAFRSKLAQEENARTRKHTE